MQPSATSGPSYWRHPILVDDTCYGVPATKTGKAAAEIFSRKAGADVINSLGGNAIIQGLGGDDLFCGDVGNGKPAGASSNDRLVRADRPDQYDGGTSSGDTAVGCETTVGVPP